MIEIIDIIYSNPGVFPPAFISRRLKYKWFSRILLAALMGERERHFEEITCGLCH